MLTLSFRRQVDLAHGQTLLTSQPVAGAEGDGVRAETHAVETWAHKEESSWPFSSAASRKMRAQVECSGGN